MFQNNSIFKKVLFNILVIMIIPLTLIMSVICYLMCVSYKSNERQQLQNYLNEYGTTIRTEIEKTLQMSEYIIKNTAVTNGLDSELNNAYDKLKYFMDVKTYIDNLTNNTSTTVMIYTVNHTLFQNSYIYRSDSLANYDAIIEKAMSSKLNIIWDEKMEQDKLGKKYITFYRTFPMNKKNLLSCRVYFPNKPSYLKNVIIAQNDSLFDQNTHVITNINEICSIALQLDMQKIHKQYFMYIFTFISLDIFLILAISIIARKVTEKITFSINSFISELSHTDILDSGMNYILNSEDADELKVIKSTINSLVLKVKEISKSYYETELEKRKIELNLLQSKLGPHILYNSLSIIKLEAYERNDTNTTAIIGNLVSYYRTMLNYGKEMIALAQELDMIKQYVTIYELAHRKQYALNIQISESLKETQILHLILQPFVENAIVHGLSGRRKDCAIHISCFMEEDYMICSIKDNGYGMTEEKLLKLKDLENYDERYGITNSYKRLKLFYGDDSKIYFDSKLNVGTTVTIKFKPYLDSCKNKFVS